MPWSRWPSANTYEEVWCYHHEGWLQMSDRSIDKTEFAPRGVRSYKFDHLLRKIAINKYKHNLKLWIEMLWGKMPQITYSQMQDSYLLGSSVKTAVPALYWVKSLAAIGNPLLNSPTASSDIDKHQLRWFWAKLRNLTWKVDKGCGFWSV